MLISYALPFSGRDSLKKPFLSGRKAIVTGSTAGVGLAIARALVRAGAQGVVNGRKADAVERAVASLSAEPGAAAVHGVVCDVGTAAGCTALIDAHPAADILVNNVGVYGVKDFFEIDDAEWERYLNVNVMSGIRLSRAYIPGMLERYWGRVVFMSSEWCLDVPSEMIHYGLTKGAALSVTHGLAKRVVCSGVTVNAIVPGPILPDPALADGAKADVCLTMEERLFILEEKQRPASIVQRASSVDEIAQLVLYLASPEGAGTNGASLRVDAGELESVAG